MVILILDSWLLILDPNNTNFTATAKILKNRILIQFILNDITISTALSPGMTILDFIRYERQLFGTKIGCREGDCGACTVLIGQLIDGEIDYRSATSCLMPLGNAHGKHIVTVEGINFSGLNPVQQSMSDEGATQCGFCTPGFVVSLTGFCMQKKNNDVISSIDGNICRCTGYKSIERAAFQISKLLNDRKEENVIEFAISKKIIPEYFLTIKKRLIDLSSTIIATVEINKKHLSTFVGGGTDLYVQKHEVMIHSESYYLSDISKMNSIREKNGKCILGGSVTVTDLIESPIIRKIFPHFLKYSKLVSSTPIRNMATLGGNFVNASPIGDYTVFFLALNTSVHLNDGNRSREVLLKNFYKGYKTLDKAPNEYIEEIHFLIPSQDTLFNFEKVSKRTNLDIASVNSAIQISVNKGSILNVNLSAGGVSPVPMYLNRSNEFLAGKKLSETIIEEVCEIAGEEISPISDVRGTATYKRFLLQQLIKAHFITLFPTILPEKFQSAYEEY